MSNVDQHIVTCTNKGNQGGRGERRKWSRVQPDPVRFNPSSNQDHTTMSLDCPMKSKRPVKINRNAYGAIQLRNISIAKPLTQVETTKTLTQVEVVPDRFTSRSSIKRKLGVPLESNTVTPKMKKIESPETLNLSSAKRRKLDVVLERKTDATHDVTQKKTDATHDVTQKKTDATHDVTQTKTDANHDVTQKKTDATHDVTQNKTDATHDVTQKKIDATHDVTQKKTKVEIPETSTMSSPEKRKFDEAPKNTDAIEKVTNKTTNIESPHKGNDFDTLDFLDGIHMDLTIGKPQYVHTDGIDFWEMYENHPAMSDADFNDKLKEPMDNMKIDSQETFGLNSPKKRKLNKTVVNPTAETDNVTHKNTNIESSQQDDDFDTLDILDVTHMDLKIGKWQDVDTDGIDFWEMYESAL